MSLLTLRFVVHVSPVYHLNSPLREHVIHRAGKINLPYGQTNLIYLMKRFFATAAVLIGLVVSANAQTVTTPPVASPEMMKLDSLTKLSQRFFNEQKIDSLYALMGTGFKSQISLEKMKEVATQVNSQLGKWTAAEPQGIKDGVGKYKATFALATLDFFISRDAEGKISTFLMKPAE